jgi:hypothetical protein
LHEFFPQGEVLAETAISTTDGVKVTDTAWLSPGRTQELDSAPCLLHAPEICIEVLSPSNSQLEMAEKLREMNIEKVPLQKTKSSRWLPPCLRGLPARLITAEVQIS